MGLRLSYLSSKADCIEGISIYQCTWNGRDMAMGKFLWTIEITPCSRNMQLLCRLFKRTQYKIKVYL